MLTANDRLDIIDVIEAHWPAGSWLTPSQVLDWSLSGHFTWCRQRPTRRGQAISVSRMVLEPAAREGLLESRRMGRSRKYRPV